MVQTACKRIGLTAPSSVVGNATENIIRLLALANEEGEDLAQRHRWQRLVDEATFTTSAAESQGAITTIAGAAFGWICDDTVWNRTSIRQWFPVSDVDWQQMKARTVTGPATYFRIRGNNLIALPTPTAGDTIAFEWVSKNWCQSSGGTGQSAWSADADTGIVDEAVMTMGVIWRWKHTNGLDYAEDFRKYETRVANLISRDGSRPRLNMGGARLSSRYMEARALVSDGSWSL